MKDKTISEPGVLERANRIARSEAERAYRLGRIYGVDDLEAAGFAFGGPKRVGSGRAVHNPQTGKVEVREAGTVTCPACKEQVPATGNADHTMVRTTALGDSEETAYVSRCHKPAKNQERCDLDCGHRWFMGQLCRHGRPVERMV